MTIWPGKSPFVSLYKCLWLFAAVTPSSPLASGLADLHLNSLPRNAAEVDKVAALTRPTGNFTGPEMSEHLPAGAATARVPANRDAFSHPSANISFERELDFRTGNILFRKIWIPASSPNGESDGLGPVYNARSCQLCHLRDGRGHPPEGPHGTDASMFLRISVPGGVDDAIAEIDGYWATRADPTYGTQMQAFGVAGHPAELRLQVGYEETTVPLAGGETARLRKPTYTLTDLGYGPMQADAMLSPRVAPQMIGLGLIEAIPAVDILAGADEDDAKGNGISGRANIVWSPEHGQPMLGRFGLKAGAPTVNHQSAAAFASDIGISNPLFPAPWGDCTPAQTNCRMGSHGDDDGVYEIAAQDLAFVTFYSRNLAVPERRNVDDPKVLHGKKVFYDTGCILCHRPKFVTHRLIDQPEQSFQLIWPYSDLLLHDMGDGLADNHPEARATGREWRTPPLWGIGMTGVVSGHTLFLHDGRARNLVEAILWHDGEARSQRDAVVAMDKDDRDALIRFLESL